MDQLLARRIAEIARDDRGGAAELALAAVNALRDWLGVQSKLSEHIILEAARALRKVHPEMAPLGRIAAEVASSIKHKYPPAALSDKLDLLREHISTAPATIAEKFA